MYAGESSDLCILLALALHHGSGFVLEASHRPKKKKADLGFFELLPKPGTRSPSAVLSLRTLFSLLCASIDLIGDLQDS